MSGIELVLPMPPNIANGAHGHWRTRHRQKTTYWALLTNLFMARQIPDPPATPIMPAGVRATFYVGARMDTDNLFRRAKWSIDWLVRNGYLVDDRDDKLVWLEMPKQVVKRGQEYRIAFTLTRL
jgi:Holliday junction resolvase RusA-like endonuclease